MGDFILCCYTFALLFPLLPGKAPCATFEFPGVSSLLTITEEENTNLSLPFYLDGDCSHTEDYRITVWDTSKPSALDSILVCTFRVHAGTCVSTFIPASCVCHDDGTYRIVKKVNRTDKEWTWTTDNTIASDKTVTLNTTYPVRVTDLTLETQGSELQAPVDPHQDVVVRCTYEQGNPFVEVLLFNRNNTVMDVERRDTTTTAGVITISHTIKSVDCDDSAGLRCEAPGTAQKKSAILLVKCPPLLIHADNQGFCVDGDQVEMRFALRSHTKEIQECNMTPLNGGSPVTRDCLRSVDITGTPPDMELTVRLDNVTTDHYGRWNLSVANDAGVYEFGVWLVAPKELVPASVTSLSVFAKTDEEPVDKNTSVNIVCIYKEGNPPVTARLLDRHGVEMEGSIYSSGQIRYRFPAVSCQDAGLIRCEAPGASHNTTMRLIVKCEPVFMNPDSNTITVESGNDAWGEFPVRTHTTNITKCSLSKSSSDVYNDEGFLVKALYEVNCLSFVRLSGTPPDLVLTLWLVDVKKEYEGQWQLNLTNKAGTGRLVFSLLVTTVHWKVIVGASVAAFVLLGVIIITVCLKKGRRPTAPPQPAIELAAIERHSLMPQEDGSNQSVHHYMEVLDSPPPSEEGSAADEATPPPICHEPGNPPADCLNLEPSRDETEEEEADWKTVPFYQNTQMEATGAGATTSDPPSRGVSDEWESDRDAMEDNKHTDNSEYVGYDPPQYENT